MKGKAQPLNSLKQISNKPRQTPKQEFNTTDEETNKSKPSLG